jgi:hypothetical protein
MNLFPRVISGFAGLRRGTKGPHQLPCSDVEGANTSLGPLYVVIPGFALHWDLPDLVSAIGDRPVLWTDPTHWVNEIVLLGRPTSHSGTTVDKSLMGNHQAFLRRNHKCVQS